MDFTQFGLSNPVREKPMTLEAFTSDPCYSAQLTEMVEHLRNIKDFTLYDFLRDLRHLMRSQNIRIKKSNTLDNTEVVRNIARKTGLVPIIFRSEKKMKISIRDLKRMEKNFANLKKQRKELYREYKQHSTPLQKNRIKIMKLKIIAAERFLKSQKQKFKRKEDSFEYLRRISAQNCNDYIRQRFEQLDCVAEKDREDYYTEFTEDYYKEIDEYDPKDWYVSFVDSDYVNRSGDILYLIGNTNIPQIQLFTEKTLSDPNWIFINCLAHALNESGESRHWAFSKQHFVSKYELPTISKEEDVVIDLRIHRNRINGKPSMFRNGEWTNHRGGRSKQTEVDCEDEDAADRVIYVRGKSNSRLSTKLDTKNFNRHCTDLLMNERAEGNTVYKVSLWDMWVKLSNGEKYHIDHYCASKYDHLIPLILESRPMTINEIQSIFRVNPEVVFNDLLPENLSNIDSMQRPHEYNVSSRIRDIGKPPRIIVTDTECNTNEIENALFKDYLLKEMEPVLNEHGTVDEKKTFKSRKTSGQRAAVEFLKARGVDDPKITVSKLYREYFKMEMYKGAIFYIDSNGNPAYKEYRNGEDFYELITSFKGKKTPLLDADGKQILDKNGNLVKKYDGGDTVLYMHNITFDLAMAFGYIFDNYKFSIVPLDNKILSLSVPDLKLKVLDTNCIVNCKLSALPSQLDIPNYEAFVGCLCSLEIWREKLSEMKSRTTKGTKKEKRLANKQLKKFLDITKCKKECLPYDFYTYQTCYCKEEVKDCTAPGFGGFYEYKDFIKESPMFNDIEKFKKQNIQPVSPPMRKMIRHGTLGTQSGFYPEAVCSYYLFYDCYITYMAVMQLENRFRIMTQSLVDNFPVEQTLGRLLHEESVRKSTEDKPARTQRSCEISAEKFCNNLDKTFKIHRFMTISSISKFFSNISGSLDETFDVTSTLQAFIQKCCQGGRCATAGNISWDHQCTEPAILPGGRPLYLKGKITPTLRKKLARKYKAKLEHYSIFGGQLPKAATYLVDVSIEDYVYKNGYSYLNQECIMDQDAVSLYPSCQTAIRYPTGPARVIECGEDGAEDIEGFDSEGNERLWVAYCEISYSGKMPKHFKNNIGALPIYKRKPGVTTGPKSLSWCFDRDARLVVSSEYAKVLRESYGYDVTPIWGVTWDTSSDRQVKLVKYLFDERLKLKSEGNALEQMYKLILNTSYGFLLLKQRDSKKIVVNVKTTSKVDGRLDKRKVNENILGEIMRKFACNPNTVYDAETVGRTVIYKTTNNEGIWNQNHLASMILGKSKEYISKMSLLCVKYGGKVCQCDTDSVIMHLPNPGVLAKIWKEHKTRYGYDLNGNQLGQANSDFEEGQYGTHIISVGKKIYCVKMCADCPGTHARMKGVPQAAIIDACLRLDKNPIELYSLIRETVGKETSVAFDMSGPSVEFELETKEWNVEEVKTGGIRANFNVKLSGASNRPPMYRNISIDA